MKTKKKMNLQITKQTTCLQITKQTTCLQSIANQFLCPITHELPINPVVAEDGRTYEKDAIKTWLRKSKRSPYTGLEMGTTLLAVTQVRNTIEEVVLSEAIDSGTALSWLKKLENEKKYKSLEKKGIDGDVTAILDLVRMYQTDGNTYKYHKWIKRGAQFRIPPCMSQFAMYLAKRKKTELMTFFLTNAAELGDIPATYEVCKMFYQGYVDTQKQCIHIGRDLIQAKYWLRRLLKNHDVSCLDTKCVEWAQSALKSIQTGQDLTIMAPSAMFSETPTDDEVTESDSDDEF